MKGYRKYSARPDLFWDRVSPPKENGCRVWLGYIHPTGYGQIGRRFTHRLAWEIAHGPIPANLCVLHHCDNRPCCEPSHLFVGTKKDNLADMTEKGRRALGSHLNRKKLTEADVGTVRRLLREGSTQLEVARKFGVGENHIGEIWRGLYWKHVAEAPP
jgi:Autographiviridae endonuclease